MTRQPQQVVMITGATDGIGLALARLYYDRGSRLILLGRKPIDELDGELFSDECYCRADLSSERCCDDFRNFLDTRGIHRVDLVILNAGIGCYGRLSESEETIRELINVNVMAPVAITRVLLPALEISHGKLVFISSIAASLPCPDYIVYGATKAAIDGFARSLAVELRDTISIQVIHPGATRTGMHAKMGISTATMRWDRFPPAAAVATQIVKTLDRGSRRRTIGIANQIIHTAGRLAPVPVDRLMRCRTRSRSGSERCETTVPRTCLITGAADGIGKATASAFAREGYHIVGVDIDAGLAKQTETEFEREGRRIVFHIVDLGEYSGIMRVLAELATAPVFEIVILNAGINAVGEFRDANMPDQKAVVDVNLRAPMLLAHGLLKANRISSDGSLVFISSLSKYVGYPTAAVYAATKDGLAAYARNLRAALYPDQHVLSVFPGPTKTAHARRHSPDNSRENRRMAPEMIGSLIVDAVHRRRSVLVPGLGNRVAAMVGHFLPRLADLAMRRYFMTRKGSNRQFEA